MTALARAAHLAALAIAISGCIAPSSTNASFVPGSTAVASSASAPRTTAPPSSDAGAMLQVHNQLRVAVGLPAVRADPRVTAAAQQHAEYLAQNGVVGHEETAGAAGFTGASVMDRLAAQGYAGATASEVAASAGSGTDDVRFLWTLPYHRLGLMHPHAVVAGWGHAEIAGRTATVGVLVYDFAASTLDRVRSPAANQSVPGSWDGDESPDVLPSGAARPVGYPVMEVYANAKAVELRAARLIDASGREVEVYVVAQIYERDYAAIVPASPLASAARYRVRFDLTVAGSDVVDEWAFKTEP